MWFASYLYDHGRISAEQFVDAIRTQLSNRPLLGRIAVQKNLLDEDQVSRILATQQRHPEQTFGQVAHELNLLSRADLAELLLVQAESVPSIQTILIDQEVLRWDEVPEALRSARQQFPSPDLVALPLDARAQ